MSVKLETLEYDIAGVALNRPDRLTAIDGSLLNAMDDALHALGSGEFRAAILTGFTNNPTEAATARLESAPVWDPM